MQLKITIGNEVLTATLIDSPPTRYFMALLPLSLTMNDLFGREKYASLPKAISTAGKRVYQYEVGTLRIGRPVPTSLFFTNKMDSRFPTPALFSWERLNRR